MFARQTHQAFDAELTGESGSGIRKSYHFLSFSRTLGASRLDAAADDDDPGDAQTLGYYLHYYLQGWGEPDMEHIIKSSPRRRCAPIYTVHFRAIGHILLTGLKLSSISNIINSDQQFKERKESATVTPTSVQGYHGSRHYTTYRLGLWPVQEGR